MARRSAQDIMPAFRSAAFDADAAMIRAAIVSALPARPARLSEQIRTRHDRSIFFGGYVWGRRAPAAAVRHATGSL